MWQNNNKSKEVITLSACVSSPSEANEKIHSTGHEKREGWIVVQCSQNSDGSAIISLSGIANKFC